MADGVVVARLPWPRADGAPPGEVTIRHYAGDAELPAIMALMAAELSEPYSIFTFRHFLDGWPKLCFVVRGRATSARRAVRAGAPQPAHRHLLAHCRPLCRLPACRRTTATGSSAPS